MMAKLFQAAHRRCSELKHVVYLHHMELDGGEGRHHGEMEGWLLLERWSNDDKMGRGGRDGVVL
jgi:hypothetical protein